MMNLEKYCYRSTWAEVSLDAIAHNVRQFKSTLGSSSYFMAVVKGDAYGHGAIPVAKAALEAGSDYLGVALLDEALQLRRAGINTPIMVLGYTPPYAVEKAIMNDITMTVFSDEVLEELISCSNRLQKLVKVHIKVETGMNRVGVEQKEELKVMAKTIQQAHFLSLEGIFTHFADADNKDKKYTFFQHRRFIELIEYLKNEGIHIPIKHCCNSAGTIDLPEMHMDMVRVGISLYGLAPSADVQFKRLRLLPAMSFKTKVSFIKTLKAGQSISYGCTYQTEKDSLIATLPVGYADGFYRGRSNVGFVMIRGKRVPIVGRICMDQTMMDVSSIPDLRIGEEVVLFGRSEEGELPVDEIATEMNTINYEVVCQLGKRVPRIYVENNNVIEVKNHVEPNC
jgi:alanine racemase